LSGADQQSGTYVFMGETIFPKFGEGAADENFRGLQASGFKECTLPENCTYFNSVGRCRMPVSNPRFLSQMPPA